MSNQHGSELTDDQLAEYEEKMAGDDYSNKAPRKAKQFWPSAKRLLGLLAPYKLALTAVFAMNAVSVVLAVYAPRVMGRAMDVIFSGVMSKHMPPGTTKEQAVEGLRAAGQNRFADMASAMDLTPGTGIDFDRLGQLIVAVLVLYVAASLLMWAQGAILNRLTMRAVFNLRERVEAKINTLPLRYFDTRQRGDVMSRTTNDVDNVQQALQQSLSSLFNAILTVVGILVMMFAISWQLALVALLAIPLTGLVMGLVGTRSQQQFTTQWKATGDVNGHVEESFSGHDVAVIFGRTEELRRTFDERNNELAGAAQKAQFLANSMHPTMQFISYLSYVAIAVLGGVKVASGKLTLGDATAFIQYSRQFNQPLGEIAGMMQMLQSGVASAERVFELLDAEVEPADSTTARMDGRAEGLVEFRDVSFSYTDEPLIQDLNLRVEPGQTAAIVGPTGAGKTTLVNLIMRFYDVDSGAITLDGTDIREYSREDLRGQIGMVLQDAVLFKGTIMDNIRYGRLDATDEEVIEAAKATYVDRFVRSLPEGYDTVVDQDGGSVSAGERQLITIARAFLSQPALLILDEATSSVDTRTEVMVQQAMHALRSNRTSFVIAHRLSTIRDADVIVVMEDGRIVEQGSHAELVAKQGAYWRLHQSQFSA
ncbi:putative ABC transporter ATP-binding protein [Corynebacterium afermentans subsp. afermentans]|uniref:Fatty acid ABC transporter ATP-binding/permease protein n=1 Tax=Corynebacterium afermentans TaxID=38286 RepID=A0A9X8R5W1_9CORY|nr:ABC transporter ATP-binding protein [Corynebacterium afermentans]OAA17576.1 multidrug ABC transporter ATP-binding protein [Corynebacterium afermentans subsp. afermentans]WJY57559.1 putative ABC transporter ATP-binding protein [Corynebacterium afermentans subsp. afermentans]SIQ54675.1 ATP-binding cassette, subfamily B [Corynebacterium afermentans]